MPEPRQITVEQAYNEACLALGEVTVQQRLMTKAASAQIEALTAEITALKVTPEPSV